VGVLSVFLSDFSFLYSYVWTLINALLLGYIVVQFFTEGEEAVDSVGWRFPGVAICTYSFSKI